MKFLGACANVCSLSILAGLTIVCFNTFSNPVPAGRALVIGSLFIPPVLQLVYTYTTISFRGQRIFAESGSLDEYAMNSLQQNEKIVGIGVRLKVIGTISSLFLCGFAILFGSLLRVIVNELRNGLFTPAGKIAFVFFFISLLLTIPTIIYNLRTFNQKWIITRD